MKLGEIIKQHRLAHSQSMEDFARKAGLSRMYISMLEKNYNSKTKKEIVPTSKLLNACAKAMGIALDDLIDQLDDDQLINVVFQSDDIQFHRSTNLDERYRYFITELSRRNETFTLSGIKLDKADLDTIKNLVDTTYDLAVKLIQLKHAK